MSFSARTGMARVVTSPCGVESQQRLNLLESRYGSLSSTGFPDAQLNGVDRGLPRPLPAGELCSLG